MAIRNPPAWMWAEACEMLEQAQRLQRQFFRFGRAVEAQPRWEPPVDIVAYGDEVQVTVALPGVAQEHVDVHAEGASGRSHGRACPAGAATRDGAASVGDSLWALRAAHSRCLRGITS